MDDGIHTKGPWKVGARLSEYRVCDTNPARQAHIEKAGLDKFQALSVGRDDLGSIAIVPMDESNMANARLIAVSPDMYEALEDIVAMCKKHLWPCPDKPNSDWAKVEKAEAVLKKAKGRA